MTATAANPRRRDLRRDFFRGLALFMIFLDHIPNNVMNHFTVRAIGFSDAAEIFIFISGYVAAMVYGRAMMRHGFLVATAQVFRRVWQLYVAHLTLFMIYMAEVSYALSRLDNPLFRDDLRVGDFLTEPHIAIVKALTLQFQPKFLDILPLYILLLLIFPLVLLALRRHAVLALAPSFLIYLVMQAGEFAFPAYPAGQVWFFNPLAWQFLFVIGAACGHAAVEGRRVVPGGRLTLLLAAGFSLLCTLIHLDWELHAVWPGIPDMLGGLLWPYLSKTNLAPLRLLNFLALAVVVARLLPPHATVLTRLGSKLVIVCGQNSLYVFCLGILLAVLCSMLQMTFNLPVAAQILYSLAGLALMLGLALLLMWYGRTMQKPAQGESKT